VDYALAIVVFGLAVAYVVLRPLLRPAGREPADHPRR